MEISYPTLRIEGRIAEPRTIGWHEFHAFPDVHQVPDVSQLVAGRQGNAVRLDGLLAVVGIDPAVTHLGLHAAHDNFHASIPLAHVRTRGLILYAVNGKPLSREQGGPFRFLIVDYASCHTDEIDECANVKFLDSVELTCGKGFDNRPQDEDEHAKLHANDDSASA
jgi:hypothetical protein